MKTKTSEIDVSLTDKNGTVIFTITEEFRCRLEKEYGMDVVNFIKDRLIIEMDG